MTESPQEQLSRLQRCLAAEQEMNNESGYKDANIAALDEAIRRWPAQDELHDLARINVLLEKELKRLMKDHADKCFGWATWLVAHYGVKPEESARLFGVPVKSFLAKVVPALKEIKTICETEKGR